MKLWGNISLVSSMSSTETGLEKMSNKQKSITIRDIRT